MCICKTIEADVLTSGRTYLFLQMMGSRSSLEVMVNWMHGASHDLLCQLENCGRFKKGSAWSVGEQIEQLWSLLKVSLSASGTSVC